MLVEYKLKNDYFTYCCESNLIYEDKENIYLSNENTIININKNNLEQLKIIGE